MSVDKAGRAAASIDLESVSKRYDGSVLAVDHISLSVRAGEFFSLLGPSGCGKTTTLRMIAGFETVDSGRIRVADADITHTPVHQREMGMVFQSYALFPHRTVAENVAFGLRMRGLPRAEIDARVKAAIELVALSGYESRRPGQLSGGQQQRVALARAVVIEPRVLLCDEPLGALDRKLRQQMQFELKHLQRTLGLTLVFVTHDQDEALAMSDRIAVMNQGRIEQVGTPAEIYRRPSTRFVADFIGEINLFEGRVSANGFTLSNGRTVPIPSRPNEQTSAGGSNRLPQVLAIRPEQMFIVDAAQAVMSGRVEQVNFMGGNALYRIDAGFERPVLLRETLTGNRPVREAGQSVYMRWDVSDGVLLDG